MRNIHGLKDWDKNEDCKNELDYLRTYIDANRRAVEIEAVRHGILNIIEDIKACQDQNIRALLYDLERCNKLCVDFLTFWQLKGRKIEEYMEKLTQEVSDEPSEDKESNSQTDGEAS